MKYNRTFHLGFSPGISNDDKVNYEWELLLDNEIVILEKIDGSNSCLKHDGAFGRSHAAPTENPWDTNIRMLYDLHKTALKDIAIYGESTYAEHSIIYTNLQNPYHFYTFGVKIDDVWQSWDDVEFYSSILDLPTVPVLCRGKLTPKELQEHIENIMLNGSMLGGEIEGVVVRRTSSFSDKDFNDNLLKYVRKNHVQTDEHWTKNWKKAKLASNNYTWC